MFAGLSVNMITNTIPRCSEMFTFPQQNGNFPYQNVTNLRSVAFKFGITPPPPASLPGRVGGRPRGQPASDRGVGGGGSHADQHHLRHSVAAPATNSPSRVVT